MLYLFTATFPFGTAETFLEDEILCLAKSFEKIAIIPLYGDSAKMRPVPKNCTVNKPLIRSKSHKYLYGLLPSKTLRYFIPDFFSHWVYTDKKRLKTWLIAYLNTNCILRSSAIQSLGTHLKPNDICYFYWGKGSNVLAAFWKGKARFVSRFHGEWDLWEESSGNYAPIRNRIASALDLAVFISRKGEMYFHERYPQCQTLLSRLGAFGNGTAAKSDDGIVRVLTCSSVYPLKRVPFILEALRNTMNLKIEWTHIGDGADFEKLQEMAKDAENERFKINLLGRLPHSAVIRYYQTNKVDLFINLSLNEGIPVSIMEAISFGVPVVATDVGGTSEIVTKESGILVSADPTIEEVADAVSFVLNHEYNSAIFWDKYYNAAVNYSSFAEVLHSLHS